MATKTVVCPECGSATAVGRYTCIECGAFLDSVAVATAPPQPAAQILNEDWGPADPDSAVAPLPGSGDPLLEDGPAVDPVDMTLPPPADQVPEVQWPPPADLGPLPPPAARVPAGSWLPPSAHLTGLEEPALSGSGAAAATTLPRRVGAAEARDWLAAIGTPERRWSAARRTIAIGAVVGLFGFLLPWGSASVANLVTVWLNVWGLAVAGTWLIALGLIALSALAVLSGRVESWPLGIPAIVLASVQLGLIWANLFGSAGRPIGILVVLVGAIVLAVGGALMLGARHEAATPDV